MYTQIPVTINTLKEINPAIFASTIAILPGSIEGVNEDEVQCVAYYDQAGTEIASCPFNENMTTFSSSVTTIGSALCYLADVGENEVDMGVC